MRWSLQGGSVLRVWHTELGAFPGEQLMRHSSNWGYVFNSPWVVYASFPMARATDGRSLSDRSLARHVARWQWAEADAYNADEGEGIGWEQFGGAGGGVEDDPAFPVAPF